ncbi:MAG: hypothetical protein ACM34K_11965 [Bacillota bacterium]
MERAKYSIIIFIAGVFLFTLGCNKSTEPEGEKSEIRNAPKTITFDADPGSLTKEHFPSYSTDYSALKINGLSLNAVKSSYPEYADKEFIIAAGDSFLIEIKNCKKDSKWKIDTGDLDIADDFRWINSEVLLLKSDKYSNPDSTVNYRFTFKGLKNSKGYICFIENSSSNASHGLIIGYTINPLNKVILSVDDIKWKFNTEKGSFSYVKVWLKGTTNAYRLRGMTYGDGLSMAMEIPVVNNNFEIEIPVSFSHNEGITLTTNTELLLYGTTGLPLTVKLINPKS